MRTLTQALAQAVSMANQPIATLTIADDKEHWVTYRTDAVWHSATITNLVACTAGDGSLVRAMSIAIAGSGPEVAGDVYAQRITDPSVAAQWTTWTKVVSAGATTGNFTLALSANPSSTIRLFYVDRTNTNVVKVVESTDNGATFGAASTVATLSTSYAAKGLASAGNDDLFIQRNLAQGSNTMSSSANAGATSVAVSGVGGANVTPASTAVVIGIDQYLEAANVSSVSGSAPWTLNLDKALLYFHGSGTIVAPLNITHGGGTLLNPAAAGDLTLSMDTNPSVVAPGEWVVISSGASMELAQVTAAVGSTLTLDRPVKYSHIAGTTVSYGQISTGSAYYDVQFVKKSAGVWGSLSTWSLGGLANMAGIAAAISSGTYYLLNAEQRSGYGNALEAYTFDGASTWTDANTVVPVDGSNTGVAAQNPSLAYVDSLLRATWFEHDDGTITGNTRTLYRYGKSGATDGNLGIHWQSAEPASTGFVTGDSLLQEQAFVKAFGVYWCTTISTQYEAPVYSAGASNTTTLSSYSPSGGATGSGGQTTPSLHSYRRRDNLMAAGDYQFDIVLPAAVTTTNAGTLSSSASASAGSISNSVSIPVGQDVVIDTAASGIQERRTVTTVSGSGPYTLSFATGLLYAHSNGATTGQAAPVLPPGLVRNASVTLNEGYDSPNVGTVQVAGGLVDYWEYDRSPGKNTLTVHAQGLDRLLDFPATMAFVYNNKTVVWLAAEIIGRAGLLSPGLFWPSTTAMGEVIPQFSIVAGQPWRSALDQLCSYYAIQYVVRADGSVVLHDPSDTQVAVWTFFDKGNPSAVVGAKFEQDDLEANHIRFFGATGVQGDTWDFTAASALGLERYRTATDRILTDTSKATVRVGNELILDQRLNLAGEVDVPVNPGLEVLDIVRALDPATNTDQTCMIETLEVTNARGKYKMALTVVGPGNGFVANKGNCAWDIGSNQGQNVAWDAAGTVWG